MIITGTVLEVLKEYPTNHFDAMLTDPPYGLGSFGHAATLHAWITNQAPPAPPQPGIATWDTLPPPTEWAETLRVLKPGSPALIYTHPRTTDLTTTSLRLAGYHIKDTLTWIHKRGNRTTWPNRNLRNTYTPIIFARKPGTPRHLNTTPATSDTRKTITQKITTNTINGEIFTPPARGKEKHAGTTTNTHETVKPLNLNHALAHLLNPPGNLLNPYAGTGSEAIPATTQGWTTTSIEQNPNHTSTHQQRHEWWTTHAHKYDTTNPQEILYQHWYQNWYTPKT